MGLSIKSQQNSWKYSCKILPLCRFLSLITTFFPADIRYRFPAVFCSASIVLWHATLYLIIIRLKVKLIMTYLPHLQVIWDMFLSKKPVLSAASKRASAFFVLF